MVTGCTLEFKSKPPLGPPALRERQLPKDQTKALEEEIIALVQKQAIKKLLPHLALRGLQRCVCSPQEGRGVAPHHQPQVPEFLFGNSPLQNGEHQEPEGCGPTRRLHGEVGSTRCISDSPNASINVQLSLFLLEGGHSELDLLIFCIWPFVVACHSLLFFFSILFSFS